MRTMLPYITPALLAVIAVLLALILWRMPAAPPTLAEYQQAVKLGDDAVDAIRARAPLTAMKEFVSVLGTVIVNNQDPLRVDIVNEPIRVKQQ